MRLSEAIRLGSLLIAEPKQSDIAACAITMAVKAVEENSGEDENLYDILKTRWPWLETIKVACPCGEKHPPFATPLTTYAIVFVPFDYHVMGDRTMTIEQLADWVGSIEPQEAPAETTLDFERMIEMVFA